MAIRVKGAPRNMEDIDVIEAAEGVVDPNGNMFKVIYLDWKNSRVHRNAHNTKTSGFEDTLITLKSGGGVGIQYQLPGNIRWLKHKITGRITGMVAKTPYNMKMLAATYKDDMWVIRDKEIRDKVKEMADALDESLKKEHHVLLDKDGFPKVDFEGVPIVESKYEFEKKRREVLKSGRAKPDTFPAFQEASESGVLGRTEEEQLEFLQRLEERKKKAKALKLEAIRKGKYTGNYTRENLAMMNINVLRKLARDKFGVENAFSHGEDKVSKKAIIKTILDKQMKEVA